MAVLAAPLITAALLRRGAGLTSSLLAGEVVGVQAVVDRGALILAKQRQEPAQGQSGTGAEAAGAEARLASVLSAPIRIFPTMLSVLLFP